MTIRIGNTRISISSAQWIKILAVTVAGLCMFVVGIFRIAAMQSQLFLMSTAIVLLPPVSFFLGRFSLMGLSCMRDDSVVCSVGDDVRVTLHLENGSRIPKFYLYARDRLSEWVHVSGAFAPPILLIWPGKSESVSYLVQADKRGVYGIGPVSVQSMDLLGFVSYGGVLQARSELVVYPKPIPIRYVENMSEAHGLPAREQGAQRGIGGDFYGLRDYQTGDELRLVHWPTTARLGTMFVIEQTQGTAKEVVVALDLNEESYRSSGTGMESALEYAITIAATLCQHYMDHGYALWFIAEGAHRHMAREADGQCRDIAHVLDHLARVEADAPISFAEVIERNRGEIPKGATLVTISVRSSDTGKAAALPEGIDNGRDIIRFELDGGSFRRDARMPVNGMSPGASMSGLPAIRRNGGLIRQGDDLRDIIEGALYGRTA